MRPRYVIITPVRDEERHLKLTIGSVSHQSILPVEWVIVDDGSTDKTGEILDEATRQNPFIRPVHRPNRGFRKNGGGVIEAVNAAYETLANTEWDFIVKLDGDLAFEADYFERCFAHFAREPRLGIGGGVVYNLYPNGTTHFEPTGPPFHVRGATKIYRRACWEQIGGLPPVTGWDTLDEIKANMLGWSTRSFTELHLLHHRPTGAADGHWRNLVKDGLADYISGYHPLFMLAKCAARISRKPFLLGPIGLAYGFFSGHWKQIPQVADPQLIRYLRGQQLAMLRGAPSIWR